jgi:crossover junction endodeoxyribonuclease RusA
MGLNYKDMPANMRAIIDKATPPPPASGPICLTLPYPPATNHLYATFRGRRILSREGRAYKADVVAEVAKSQRPTLLGEVAVTVRIYRPRRSGDLDGRLKALLDGLTGAGVWRDDSQVVEIHATRHDDKANPRVEVEVCPVS